ncbi:type-1 angiotensin II receptor-associated protein isoform X2 [Pezoporus wallicus]|uniref:type-1 angiotensin II receptor-associated protein isoform X2 n=1 Tax=Pezoporus wallicus TaxID=35540 RepID=UPI00254C6555|nr:type-1 angiotensin II receptor-associated protein isoform X2 [Pezoporus wallicus]XP_061306063.1 type-1 angiotensin II receptor-associated protein isoform X2 [Pezoporus flaviventris]
MELPAVNLKAIILVHWLLTVWGCMNHMFPASYAWGNFSVLAVGIWAIVQRDSLDAILMFLTGLLLTVLTDIIHVSVFYPPNSYLTDAKRFSIGMAIFSLLLKPLSCYLVYRMYRERGGEYTFNLGVTCAGQDRSTYEPIDQQDAPPQWADSSKIAQHPY